VLEKKVLDILEVLADLTSRLEVLIIDDGSDDGTEEIAWDLSARFTQVDYIRHPFPLGMLEALRTGYDATAGEYLLIHTNLAELDVEELARCWQNRYAATDVTTTDSAHHVGSAAAHDEPGWLQRLTKWGRAMLAGQPELPDVTPMRLICRHDLTDVLLGGTSTIELRWDPGTAASARPLQTPRRVRYDRQSTPMPAAAASGDAPLDADTPPAAHPPHMHRVAPQSQPVRIGH